MAISTRRLHPAGALRRTSEVGRSNSLSEYDDSPAILYQRWYWNDILQSARRKLQFNKGKVETQPRFCLLPGGVN